MKEEMKKKWYNLPVFTIWDIFNILIGCIFLYGFGVMGYLTGVSIEEGYHTLAVVSSLWAFFAFFVAMSYINRLGE